MNEHLDNDALLLLYVSDELTSEQRAAVDQRLASEPELREALKQLTLADAWTNAQLARADEVTPLNDTVAAAIARRTGRALRQALVDKLARRPAVRPPRRGLPFGWRSYSGAAVAASLFVGLLVWWGSRNDDSNRGVVINTDSEWVTDKPVLDETLATAEVPDDPEDERLALTYGATLALGPAEPEPGSLESVETELRNLRGVGRGDTMMMDMQ
jgi:anti-sigma factor RsiW